MNTTATIAGTFAYNPAAGVILNTGTQKLNVIFTPTDTDNYTSVTREVIINVMKATPIITWSVPAAISYITALSTAQLKATANVAGIFTYTPTIGAILNAGIQPLLRPIPATTTTRRPWQI